MKGLLAVAVVLIAGCSSAAPEAQEAPVEDVGPVRVAVDGDPETKGRDGSGEFIVHSDVAVTVCTTGDEAGYSLTWQHVPLRRQAGDSSVEVVFQWTAANPTLEWLRFRLLEDTQMGGSGGSGLREWDAASPHSLVLSGADLEALPEKVYVQVSATGCMADLPAGAHAMPGQDQPVSWLVSWNTLDLA